VGWHYEAERLDGEGGAVLLAGDLPLQDVSITQTLSGADSMTASITPEVTQLVGPDGLPLLKGDWSTAIYAITDEEEVVAGTVLDEPRLTGPQLELEGVGFGGYPYGQPCVSSQFWVGIDAIDAAREVWKHLIAQPGGDLGVNVDQTTMSGVKLGTALKQGQFDTINGPLTFEQGPFRLAWYQTQDLGEQIDQLAKNTPFDWRERHTIASDGGIDHHIDFGYPKLGRRIENLRFVIGENVALPTIAEHGGEFATDVLVLGAGEGAAMIRGYYSGPRRGVRRSKVVQDQTLKTVAAANARAKAEWQRAQNVRDITSLTLFDHPHAPVGAVQVGDELFLEGRVDWTEVAMWVRVTSRTIRPADLSSVTLTVSRTDRMVG
jgi:hypothetical protein